MPTNPEEGTLFLDGWESALTSVPDGSLKSAFSDALASGKPFSPGLVVQSYREKIGVGEGVLEGIGWDVFESREPAVVEDFGISSLRHFPADGQEGLVHQHRQERHPGGGVPRR